MSVNDFLTKQNVDLLWEVIIDDDLFKNKPKELINQIGSIFTSNLRGFNEAEKNNSNNLMSMNKRFIGIILNHSRSIIIQSQSQSSQKQKGKELITSTDLQTERMSQFEKDLSQKQSEFTSAMSLPVPPVPQFSDNNLDEPIGEMELAIKKALEQRNYDIEQVSKNLNKSNADSWLKPQETSLKSEKIVPLNNSNQKSNYIQNSNVQNSLKYIKIADENIENTIIKKDIIDLSKQKHISWEDENISLQIVDKEDENDIIENNIFKKLKKINPEINQEIVDPLSINNRMNILEDKIEGLNNKIDLIIKILSEN
jgi:hypothetical protein